MRTRTRKQNIKAVAVALHQGEKLAVGLLLILTVILAFSYVYFLGSAVVHAVERKEVQQNIVQANSRIADLEVEYLQKKDKITTDLAVEMGFRTIAQKQYVERARYLGQANSQ